MKRKSLFFSLFLVCMSQPALCHTQTSLVPTTQSIQNLDKVIDEVKKNTDVPVLFPNVISKEAERTYYASYDLSPQKYGISYLINIDSTPQCHGVHACNIGFVKAEKDADFQMYRDRHNKIVTVPVTLENNIKAYYTPGHAMGDYFPANIQWREKNILYTVSWPTTREALIQMANSAIHAESASGH